ncbi:HNH endonuclease [Rhodococcoides kyotonense]|nr:HNH endonuclease [Rhodococcus kyotonensis]
MTSTSNKAAILAEACTALTEGEDFRAADILRTKYPFVSTTKVARRYTERQSLRIFHRDGFIDRYSGERLVHPGALRLLSIILPDEFPADPNWAMSRTHIGFWELFPSIDHPVPVARGGPDDDTNWVTTSMLRNSAKAHWTLDELGWSLLPAGDTDTWDGLTAWFLDYLNDRPQLPAAHPYLRRWLSATIALRGEVT